MSQIDFGGISKQLFVYLWTSALLWLPIIFLLLRFHDKLQITWGFISSFLRFWKWCRKSSIKNTIEGNLNSFARKINADFDDLIVPKVKIEFVNEKNLESFINKGQPIIRMNFSRNNNENLVNATFNYVKVALLDKAKNYIHQDIINSVDLNISRKMLVENKQNEAILYFDSRFLIPEFEKSPDLKNYYNHIQEIDEAGFLTRLLLREYKDFGYSIFPAMPSDDHKTESMDFFNFVHALSIRAKEEETPLCFNKAHIHIGIILVSKRETYEMYGLEAYLRRIRLLTKYGVNTFYLFARGEIHSEILKKLRAELLKNNNFREICNRKYYTKDQLSTFSLIKLDYEGFVSQAKTTFDEAQKNNSTIEAIIVRVEKNYVEADIKGISVTIPTQELSSKSISDARKYFQPDEELKVRVITSSDLNNVVVSNKNSNTDPVIRIEKDYSADKLLKAKVKEIIDTGLLVELEDGMKGFIPFSKATFSRFEHLDMLYRIGQTLEVKTLNFNPYYKSLVLSIAQLKDPWADVKSKYKIDQIFEVKVCSIEEKKIICELEPGVEGVIWKNDLGWTTSDINLLNIKLGDRINVKIKSINNDWKIIQLSRKEVLDNPVLIFYEKNKNLELTAEVKDIVERYAVVIEFANGVKGLIHISELDWSFITNIQVICSIGSKVKVKLLYLDKEKNIIYASRKQVLTNPIQEFLRQYKKGDTVRGKTIKNDVWGAQVKVNKGYLGVNCFVVKGEISNLFYVEDARHSLEEGQEYSFVIKSIDLEKQRVLLSRKEFFDSVFQSVEIEYAKPYRVRVIGKTNTGTYVVEYDDYFQALVLPSPSKPEKKIKINIGSLIDVCIAQKNNNQNIIEVYIA